MKPDAHRPVSRTLDPSRDEQAAIFADQARDAQAAAAEWDELREDAKPVRLRGPAWLIAGLMVIAIFLLPFLAGMAFGPFRPLTYQLILLIEAVIVGLALWREIPRWPGRLRRLGDDALRAGAGIRRRWSGRE